MGQHPAAWRASRKARRPSPAGGVLLGVAIGAAMWVVALAVVYLAL